MVFTIKRTYDKETKKILRQLNGYVFYSFDTIYIDVVNQIVKINDDVVYYDVHHNVISQIIHASYRVKHIEYVIFGTSKGGLNE